MLAGIRTAGERGTMKLVVAAHFPEEQRPWLEDHLAGPWQVVAAPGGANLAQALADADACVSMSWDGARPPAPRLRLLQLPGAGLDLVDWAAVPAQAAVCNVFEHEIGMAEYVLLAMLEREVGMARMHANVARGDWRDSLYGGGGLHGELFGRTVGIVGHGRIGRAVAARAKAFGVRVLAATRTPGKADANVDRMVGMDRLAEVLGEADYLVLACPLVEATRGLIGRAELAAMKDGAVLINVARGPVVDEDALYEACRSGRIGATVDTWYRYPSRRDEVLLPSRHPFHELPSVTMTPHASGWSRGLLPRRWRAIADNLNRLAAGRPLANLVRAPHGPPPAG